MRTLLLLALLATTATAQPRWSWPDTLHNMQVLPADLPADDLAAAMRGYSMALGVRCTHCHDGEPGAPLSAIDFASDANHAKDRAREMIRMMGSIDRHLTDLDGDRTAAANCATCHRGRPIPSTLTEELTAAYADGGLEAAVARRAELKEEWFGRGVFDFMDERALWDLAAAAEAAGDAEGVVAIHRHNTELFPASTSAWTGLGMAQAESGDTAGARASLEKALELEPRNRRAAMVLESLGE